MRLVPTPSTKVPPPLAVEENELLAKKRAEASVQGTPITAPEAPTPDWILSRRNAPKKGAVPVRPPMQPKGK